MDNMPCETFLEAYKKLVEENLLLRQQLEDKKEEVVKQQPKKLTFKEHKYELDYINQVILKETRFTNEEINTIVNGENLNSLYIGSIKISIIKEFKKHVNKIKAYLNNKNTFIIENWRDINFKNHIELIPLLKKYLKQFNYDLDEFILEKDGYTVHYKNLTENQLQEIIEENESTKSKWRINTITYKN